MKQPSEGVTYAHKIDKAEARIDWALDADAIGRRIRAFDPFPGAVTDIHGEQVKVFCYELDSALRSNDEAPGTILSVTGHGVTVACGQGALLLTGLQRAGGKRLPVADFLRGSALQAGMRFEAAATD